MTINNHQHSEDKSIRFVDDGYVLYNGSSSIDQFAIGRMQSNIENYYDFTRYTIIIPMKRIFTHQLLIIFIPTFILWLFGYSTLFIDIQYPNDRFMGAGTALLVMVTL